MHTYKLCQESHPLFHLELKGLIQSAVFNCMYDVLQFLEQTCYQHTLCN